ncbi:MAG: zinc ribbon domain-containing protein [Myxococcota bacterium]|nr:zinc ribbon domain-containing protein [Myxococcota bacterium]
MKSLLASLLLVVLAGASPPAHSADDEPLAAPGVPDVTSGNGVLEGTVSHSNPKRSTAGLTVGLYALSPEGRPSLRQGRTETDGSFRFENISNSPQVTYLVGVRIDEIPYGDRVVFEEGSTRATVHLAIDDPIASLEPVTLQDSVVSFRWRAGELEIQEEHRLENESDRVVRFPRTTGSRSRAPFEVQLPDDATEIAPGFGQVESYFERRGNRLLFWGPLHPGENQVQFSYRVPRTPADADSPLVFRPRIRPAPATFTALIPESDPEPEITGLTERGSVTPAEVTYRTFRADGETDDDIAITLRAPNETTDTELLEMAGANVWLELDDTALDVKVDYNFLVGGDARLVGTPEAPAVTLQVPPGAELLGIAPIPERIGAILDAHSKIQVAGPLGPGPAQLRLHYRIPADTRGASIDLSFPWEIPVLNVLVADTGVRVENDRLHRRRPMRQGTRLFLHREAFAIEPGESLSIGLRPVNHSQLSRMQSRIAVLLIAALAIAFMLLPLRQSGPGHSKTGRPKADSDPKRLERETLYASMRDLEHDFETGKLEAADHAQLKRQLELRAAELMTSESPAEPADNDDAIAACSSCGTPLAETWEFCARCGTPL